MTADYSARPLPPNSPLRLKRRARQISARWRFTVELNSRLKRLARRIGRVLRRVGQWLNSIQRPSNFKTYSARQIKPSEIIQDITPLLGFDAAQAREAIDAYRYYYDFVPRDSVEYHLAGRFNKAAVASLPAEIVLYPASHPLLFKDSASEFFYDKHHEIPYHNATPYIQLINFSFSSTVRPFYRISTNIYDVGNVYELDRDAIYIGGSANYGHFFTDCFPRFEAIVAAMEADSTLAAKLPKLVVVYCQQSELEFLQRSFHQFEFMNLLGLEYSVVYARRLYLATYIAFPLGVRLLRRGFENRRVKAGPKLPDVRPQKVYLSREGFSRRRLANEDQLINALKERGFVSISSLNYSIEELSEILSETRLIVTGTGAHTVNTVFMPPGATMLEIVPTSFDTNKIWQYNHSLFLSAELRYLRFVVDDSSASRRGGETQNTGIFDWEGVVDIEAFIRYLESDVMPPVKSQIAVVA